MVQKKKVTRKQLLKEPDEFITFSGRLIAFATLYKNQIVISVCIILGLIGAMGAFRYYVNSAEEKGFVMLEKARLKYDKALQTDGAEKAYEATAADFNAILDDYAGRRAGQFARLFYANICYRAGKVDEAIKHYQQALDVFGDNPSFRNLVLSGLGYAYEFKQDAAQAIKYFEMIVQGDQPLLKDEALFNLGRLYAAERNDQKSTDAYGKIVSEHTESMYYEIAAERIAG